MGLTPRSDLPEKLRDGILALRTRLVIIMAVSIVVTTIIWVWMKSLEPGTEFVGVGLNPLTSLLGLGWMLFLFYRVLQGRNWARLFFCIGAITNVAMAPLLTIVSLPLLEDSKFLFFLILASNGLALAAGILMGRLFLRRDVKAYFVTGVEPESWDLDRGAPVDVLLLVVAVLMIARPFLELAVSTSWTQDGPVELNVDLAFHYAYDWAYVVLGVLMGIAVLIIGIVPVSKHARGLAAGLVVLVELLLGCIAYLVFADEQLKTIYPFHLVILNRAWFVGVLALMGVMAYLVTSKLKSPLNIVLAVGALLAVLAEWIHFAVLASRPGGSPQWYMSAIWTVLFLAPLVVLALPDLGKLASWAWIAAVGVFRTVESVLGFMQVLKGKDPGVGVLAFKWSYNLIQSTIFVIVTSVIGCGIMIALMHYMAKEESRT